MPQEAADSGLLIPVLAAAIRRVKGTKQLGACRFSGSRVACNYSAGALVCEICPRDEGASKNMSKADSSCARAVSLLMR